MPSHDDINPCEFFGVRRDTALQYAPRTLRLAYRILTMALTQDQKKRFRKLAHHLKPVVMVAENGLSEGVMNELERALEDHELIKIRINVLDRDDKTAIIDEVCKKTKADLAQVIGKVAVLYRPAKKQNPKLSNLVRLQP
jgi:RNA-binding protein